MPANIYIYCPITVPPLDRDEFAEEMERFFGEAAEDCGAGSGVSGFNLDYEFAQGEDIHKWADRLKTFLVAIEVPTGTRFDIFPDDWRPGDEWRRVEVFGSDLRRSDNP